jgi:oxidase EvaA
MTIIKKNSITSWISNRRGLSNLKVETIPISNIKNWILTGKNITNENNYYFSIIGVEVYSEQKKELIWEKPIILQQEVGILGFIIQEDKILLQAKTEPGNVNGTQIGPSVQATVSNYMKVHNGDETKFLRYFLGQDDSCECISNSTQLEHGARFMNKSNRNSIIRLRNGYFLDDMDDRFRWFEIKELLLLLEEDYLINTDARSVLISCNWEELTEKNIVFFSDKQHNELKYWLHESYYQKSSTTRIFEVLEELQNKNKYNFKIKDLDKLKNWNVNENVIYDNDQVEFIVQGVRVSVADREVSFWEQPIVHNIGLEKIVLYCQKKDGILKFLLNAQIIIGMNEALVWGPSDQNTRYDEKINFGGQTILAECMQSDEGGRFYHSKCLYQIIDVSEKVKVPESDMSYWASLFEIQNLTMQSKKTTNELRSVLSLLLKFL